MTRPEKGLSSNEFLLGRIRDENPLSFLLSLFFFFLGGGGYFSGLIFLFSPSSFFNLSKGQLVVSCQ